MKLTYCSAAPTEPGWYWWSEPSVNHVQPIKIVQISNLGLYVTAERVDIWRADLPLDGSIKVNPLNHLKGLWGSYDGLTPHKLEPPTGEG